MKNCSSYRERSLRKYTSTGNFAPNDAKYRAHSGTMLSKLGYLCKDKTWALAQFKSSYQLRNTNLSVPVHYGASRMLDTVGLRNQWNYCEHDQYRCVTKPYGLWYYSSSSIGYEPYYRQSFPILTIPRYAETQKSLANKLWDQDFSARAYWTMRPRFEGNVSLINSIFELKDFSDVIKNSGKFGNVLAHLAGLGKFLSISPKARKQVAHGIKVQNPTSAIAEGWLTKVLAIDPTIKDFLAISAQAMTTAREAQEKYMQDGIDGKISHYREFVYTTNETIAGNNDYRYWGIGHASSLERNASMFYYYGYTPRKTLDAIITYWGLTGTVEAFWNIIPRSFVLDYFITVGKSLHMARLDTNTSTPSVERYMESLKYVSTNGTHALLLPGVYSLVLDGKHYPGGSGRPLLVSGLERKVYLRQPMDPYKGPALPRLKLPSLKQTGTMLALLRCMF